MLKVHGPLARARTRVVGGGKSPASRSPADVPDRLARPGRPLLPGHDQPEAGGRDRDRDPAARKLVGGAVAQQPARVAATRARQRRVGGAEREGAAGDRHLVAGARGPSASGGGTRNRTAASAASPNRRSRFSSRSSIALSSPSDRTPPDRRALIVVARSGRSPTGVRSGWRAVQPRSVTGRFPRACPRRTGRRRPQGPARR